MKLHRDILKHSSIYGVGQILGRVASLLLLPLYTRCLTPADYGVVAILDLTAGILAVLVGAGMTSAVTRFHFDADGDEWHDRVWWTGLSYVTFASGLLIAPMWLGRDWLAEMTLGPGIKDGATFYTLALATMWFGTFSEVFDSYLRVQKRSALFVALSFGRLLLNVGLNVYFLVVRGDGIGGLLVGNLLATAAYTLTLFVIFCASRGRFVFDRDLARKLLHFGSPLVATALLSMLIHEADRYFLRIWVDLDQVGLYSLAYKVGQAVNMLCLVPFSAIWGVVVYEIARSPDAKRQYAMVFEHFVAGLSLVLLAASLFARPLLTLLTTDDYGAAADFVPVICLGYLCFSLHEQFRVPVLLTKQTQSLVPVYLFAALLNLACNVVLIPRWHAAGAAWASAITYAGFSIAGLLRYRRIEVIPYPFRRCIEIVVGMSLSWIACHQVTTISPASGWTMSAVVWLAWAALLFGKQAIQWFPRHSSGSLQTAMSVVQPVGNEKLTG